MEKVEPDVNDFILAIQKKNESKLRKKQKRNKSVSGKLEELLDSEFQDSNESETESVKEIKKVLKKTKEEQFTDQHYRMKNELRLRRLLSKQKIKYTS